MVALKAVGEINETMKNEGAAQEASTDTTMSPPNVEEPQLFEIKEVDAHKTVKGTKGFHYRCVWSDSSLEPSWEPETHIKATADKLLNLYWRSATKSLKPDPLTLSAKPASLKQSLLHTTKRVQLPPKHLQEEP